MQQRTIKQIMNYRHEQLSRDLNRINMPPTAPLRVLITGAPGLISTALKDLLESGGHKVFRLVRRPPASSTEIAWDPAINNIDSAAMEGFNAVIHLAGESIGAERWNENRRRIFWNSRVPATELLCSALSKLRHPPAVIVSASAVGYYGETDNTVDETAPGSDGFLSELAAAWEQATEPDQASGIRVVNARMGTVLSRNGGLLKRLLPIFRKGMGDVIGNGRQPLSWIGLDDAAGALHFLMATEQAHSAINVVAPIWTTNRELRCNLAAVLRRPAFIPVPNIIIRALFGEMGNQLILKGQAVRPARLPSKASAGWSQRWRVLCAGRWVFPARRGFQTNSSRNAL